MCANATSKEHMYLCKQDIGLHWSRERERDSVEFWSEAIAISKLLFW